jgi:hypothetical protein
MGSSAYSFREFSKIRNDPDHLNWHAVGSALLFLSDGLRKYAEKEMKDVHAVVANKVGAAIKCNCTSPPGAKPNPHGRATACTWAQELKQKHVFKNKTHIPWDQSDSSKWHDPIVGYWEIAKLYMSDLGSDPAKVTDPDSTDISPLLNLFRFCKHFNIQTSSLKAVTDIRNEWAHAPKNKLSKSDKSAAFQAIKQLMNDPELVTSKEVRDCLPKVEKAEIADLSILEENELRLLQEYRRINESEKNQTKERIFHLIALLVFIMSIPRHLPILLQRCLTVFFIFSQVGDRSGIVSDEGKIYCNIFI